MSQLRRLVFKMLVPLTSGLQVVAMAPNLRAMASNLKVMASNPIANVLEVPLTSGTSRKALRPRPSCERISLRCSRQGQAFVKVFGPYPERSVLTARLCEVGQAPHAQSC